MKKEKGQAALGTAKAFRALQRKEVKQSTALRARTPSAGISTAIFLPSFDNSIHRDINNLTAEQLSK